MKRMLATLAISAVLGVAMAASPTIARPAEAASCVQIHRIYFNSPGADTGSNTSRNGEWIQLKNHCTTAKSLTSWRIRDLAGHTYRFGTYSLTAGGYVKIHTGSGTNNRTDRYWGSGWYIWNNTGDTAYLKNAVGTTIDTCRYGGAGSWVYC